MIYMLCTQKMTIDTRGSIYSLWPDSVNVDEQLGVQDLKLVHLSVLQFKESAVEYFALNFVHLRPSVSRCQSNA